MATFRVVMEDIISSIISNTPSALLDTANSQSDSQSSLGHVTLYQSSPPLKSELNSQPSQYTASETVDDVSI